MRRRRSVRRDDGITLFPFLAVLICTMGSLIVLLVIMVQQAKANAVDVSRQRAAHRAEQERRQQADQEQQRRAAEDLEWQLQVLRGSREQTAAQLEDRRRELSHLEDVIRDLEQQLQSLATEAQQIKQRHPLDPQGLADAQQKIDDLKRKIEQKRKEVDATRERLETQEPSYAIVPYDGPHGTHRRPIFVECLEDRIVLQPEGIELRADDFREPITDDNPLASALRAKREYLADVLQEDDGQPYPLLVVRPDGARAYAAARAAMKSWEAEFGYELVDAALPLEYPPVDPALTALMRRAVDQSRARRKYLQSIAPARFGRPDSVLRPSHRGGFESQPAASSFGSPVSDEKPSAVVQADPAGNPSGTVMGNENWGQPGPASPSGDPGDSVNGPEDAPEFGFPHWGKTADPTTASDPLDSRAGEGTLAGSPRSSDRMSEPSSRPPGARFARRAKTSSDGRPEDVASSSAPAGPGGPSAAGGSESAGSGSGGALAPQAQSATVSLSESRGRDWALPENTLGATGITRPIRIACYADRLVLLPEDRGKEKPHVLRFEGQLEEQVDNLVSQLWERMEGWGIAGPGMYWKPTLVAEVAADGEQRYAELTRLLQNSGITVKRKP